MHGAEHWVGLLIAGVIIAGVTYGIWTVCEIVHTRVVAPAWERWVAP